MRLATLRTGAGPRLHVHTAGGYVDLCGATGDERLSTLRGFLAAGDEGLAAARGIPPGAWDGAAELAAAVPDPGRILCLGRNFADHAEEMNKTTSEWPEVFVRFTSCLAGPFDDILLPSFSARAYLPRPCETSQIANSLLANCPGRLGKGVSRWMIGMRTPDK